MKKAIAVVLTAGMALSCLGCANGKPKEDTFVDTSTPVQEAPQVGGWSRDFSPQITPELEQICRQGLEGLEDAAYTPVAVLGSQVVAGTNYRVLLRVSPAGSDAGQTYAIGSFYQDPSGKVSLTNLRSTQVPTKLTDLPGGWTQPESVDLTQEARAAFDTAMEELAGGDYQPIALVALQVAAGTNYGILCKAGPTAPGARPEYAIVYVSRDLQGQAKILEIADLK